MTKKKTTTEPVFSEDDADIFDASDDEYLEELDEEDEVFEEGEDVDGDEEALEQLDESEHDGGDEDEDEDEEPVIAVQLKGFIRKRKPKKVRLYEGPPLESESDSDIV